MKKIKRKTAFVTILLVLVGFTSCNQNILQEKKKIGIIAPLTGDGATYGASMKRGFNLAFDGDTTYTLIYEDSKFDSKLAVTELEKLIGFDKVKIIYGEAASGVSLAMVPISNKNKVIQFSSISSSDDLQKASDYFFRNVPRNSIQGKTAAEFVFNTLKVSEAAIIKDNDDYGLNLSKSFEDIFKVIGGKIVSNETYNSGDKNFRSQLEKTKLSGARAVFIPGNYTESAIILKQAEELGIRAIFIGGDGSYSPKLIEGAGTGAEGFYCTIMGVETANSFYNDFKARFVAKYTQQPDVYDAYAYEAGIILRTAIDKAGYDAEKIKKYLYSNSFPSLTGDLMFDIDGEVLRDYNLVRIENGAFVSVSVK